MTGALQLKQYKGDKIYRLKDGYNGYYVLDEIINNTGFDLTIIGGGTPDVGDPKPTMPATLQTSGTGGTPFNFMFNVFANITLRGIYFANATADGVFNAQFFMGVSGNGVRVFSVPTFLVSNVWMTSSLVSEPWSEPLVIVGRTLDEVEPL